MDLYDEAIGAGGDRRVGEGRHQVSPPRRVAGIGHHRKMGLPLEHGNRGQIERVAGRVLEGPDASLS